MSAVAAQFRGDNCMPTYEYLCKTCSHRFEQWQKMADEALTICPECGGSIRRVYYPAGIVFKGSGFYKTDHNASASTAENNGHAKKSENDATPASSDTNTASESKSTSTETSSSSSTTTDNKVPATTK